MEVVGSINGLELNPEHNTQESFSPAWYWSENSEEGFHPPRRGRQPREDVSVEYGAAVVTPQHGVSHQVNLQGGLVIVAGPVPSDALARHELHAHAFGSDLVIASP